MTTIALYTSITDFEPSTYFHFKCKNKITYKYWQFPVLFSQNNITPFLNKLQVQFGDFFLSTRSYFSFFMQKSAQ